MSQVRGSNRTPIQTGCRAKEIKMNNNNNNNNNNINNNNIERSNVDNVMINL